MIDASSNGEMIKRRKDREKSAVKIAQSKSS